MRTLIKHFMNYMLLFASIFVISCEDGPDNSSPIVSFETFSQEVSEADDIIFIPFSINRGEFNLVTDLQFTFSGTSILNTDYEVKEWTRDGLYLNILDDENWEQRQTIVITLKKVTGGEISLIDNTHTVQLVDDDVTIIGFKILNATIKESQIFKTTINLTPLLEGDIIGSSLYITGSASPFVDFENIGTLIENGNFYIIVKGIEDGVVESPETIIINIQNISHGNAMLSNITNELTLTLTITD